MEIDTVSKMKSTKHQGQWIKNLHFIPEAVCVGTPESLMSHSMNITLLISSVASLRWNASTLPEPSMTELPRAVLRLALTTFRRVMASFKTCTVLGSMFVWRERIEGAESWKWVDRTVVRGRREEELSARTEDIHEHKWRDE